MSKKPSDAPIGTKAPSIAGGHWTKTENGWKWGDIGESGSTYPTPGGDWNGKLIHPKKFRKVRCLTSFNITVSWGISQSKDGKWRITSVGSARHGRNPIPCDFIPYEITSEVMNAYRPEFNSFDEAADYARAI